MAILFSYLFLDNYRSLEKREICFDHRYKFDETTNTVMKEDDQKGGFGSYFYGKNIYSATCLVGKNGEGKTSCIDFLRDSFALIKFNLDSGRLFYRESRNGVVDLSEKELRKYHLDAGIRFLVIFKSGDTDYYVTNMDEVRLDKGASNKCRAYNPPKHKEGDIDYRIAYFSMLRLPDGVTAEQRAFIRKREAESTEEGYYNQKITDIQTLSEQYMYDLSEESLNSLRARENDGINADLLMQMAFFDSGKTVLQDILGANYETRIKLLSVETGGVQPDIQTLKEKPTKMNMLILDALTDPAAYFWPFSSGQYSRFAFLARLYWFMGGDESFLGGDRMETLRARSRILWGGRRSFDHMKYFSLDSDSVVLLIDEGELYYHPEWQRRFVKDVFDIISACKTKVNVQVVFTTSSTFMLSDILREDVVVLSRPNAEQRHYLDEDIQTFGQNIHMLLANRFFMDSTIGERAENLITGLFEMLTEKEDESADKWRERVKETINERFGAYVGAHSEIFKMDAGGKKAGYDKFVQNLIESIGEDFYRRQLLGMFEEYKRKTREPESQEELVRRLLLEKMETADAAQKESLMQAIELLGGKSGQ